jgi:hypothetical protein
LQSLTPQDLDRRWTTTSSPDLVQHFKAKTAYGVITPVWKFSMSEGLTSLQTTGSFGVQHIRSAPVHQGGCGCDSSTAHLYGKWLEIQVSINLMFHKAEHTIIDDPTASKRLQSKFAAALKRGLNAPKRNMKICATTDVVHPWHHSLTS